MSLLTSFVFVGGAVVTGIAARRRLKDSLLIHTLIDGKSKVATLPPPKPQLIVRAQQLSQDLFGDTRQQYQQLLNTSYDTTTEQAAEQKEKRNLMVATTGLGLATAGALLSPLFYLPSIVAVLYGLRMFTERAYRIVLKERRMDYRVLWAMVIPAALAGGFVWVASFGTVCAFFNNYLVAKTENRSKQSIADLFGGEIRTVWLLVNGIEVETPLEEVQIGDSVVVHTGQMIPVDGVITKGAVTIDQHMLTGEAQPFEAEVGDKVLASTVVLTGRLTMRVEKAGEATVASQITQILNKTDDFKLSLQSRTDRWLNKIMWPILGLSILALPLTGVAGAIAVLWYYPGGRMVIFGPLSMLSYLQLAAQKGILVKDGRALEALDEIDTVVFDKTGTLTLEQPTVSQIICCNGLSETALLRYAAAAEAKQSHPIARAILQAAAEHGLELPTLTDAEYKVGYGLKTQIDGHTIRIGSVRFMTMEGINIPLEITAQQAESHTQGHSLVLVTVDNEMAGAIELVPTIRPEARKIIDSLHTRGIKTVIISGDNEAPTRQLATKLSIDHYYAEVLPEDKANLVKQLQAEGHKVCFIGDGINDSIALKTANISVSLRGATTIATDMAQIVFIDGTLNQLLTLFDLADDFSDNMRANLLAATLPGTIGIAGTLLFGWGITLCVFLVQISGPVGIYNALKPLLDERRSQEQLRASPIASLP